MKAIALRRAYEAEKLARKSAWRKLQRETEAERAAIQRPERFVDPLRGENGRMPLDELMKAVAAGFGLSVDALLGPGRVMLCVDARACLTMILRERGCSFPVIGRVLGGRDHSSVINSMDNFPIYARRNSRVMAVYERFRDTPA